MTDQEEATAGDADLVLRTRSGDSVAFAELWRRHYRSGIIVARSVSPGTDADDLVQEAYTRIYESIRKGGGPTGSFRAYLFTSIRNTAAGWGRTRRETTIDALETMEDPSTTEQATEDALDRGLTYQAFRSLPTRWQEVLWYSEVETMKPSEIAPLLGMKASAVAQLTFRAREGLREAWVQAHLRSVADDSDCAWSIERLGAYARNNTGRRDRARLEAHLGSCARCTIVASEASEVSSRLALVLIPLTVGVTGTAGYLASLQSGASAVVALAAMPSSVVQGAVTAGATSVVGAGSAAGIGSAAGAVTGTATLGGTSGVVTGGVTAGAATVGAVGAGGATAGAVGAGAAAAGTALAGTTLSGAGIAGIAAAGLVVAGTVAAAVGLPSTLPDAAPAPAVVRAVEAPVESAGTPLALIPAPSPPVIDPGGPAPSDLPTLPAPAETADAGGAGKDAKTGKGASTGGQVNKNAAGAASGDSSVTPASGAGTGAVAPETPAADGVSPTLGSADGSGTPNANGDSTPNASGNTNPNANGNANATVDGNGNDPTTGVNNGTANSGKANSGPGNNNGKASRSRAAAAPVGPSAPAVAPAAPETPVEPTPAPAEAAGPDA